MNTACALETESQNKRKTLGQRLANINSAQSSECGSEGKKTLLNKTLKPPLMFCLSLRKLGLKWLCSKILKLRCLKSESLCNSPNTRLDSDRQQVEPMLQLSHSSQVSMCRIRHRGTGSDLAPDTEEGPPSTSKGLPLSAAFLGVWEDVLAVNRVELRSIAHTVIGYRCGSSVPALCTL